MRAERLLKIAGVTMLCIAAIISVYNIVHMSFAGQDVERLSSELSARIGARELAFSDYQEEVIPDYLLNPDMEMPTEEIDGHDYIGKIEMPGASKEFPVLSEWSYPNLDIAPCRYEGSAYKHNLVVFAHNYPGQFDFLKDMAIGDPVWFYDVDGNAFHYNVSDIRTLKPEETELLYDRDWDLSLFTCTSTGAARIVLGCTIEESSAPA